MVERTLVIGDIHGGFKALMQVLERSDFNPAHDTLICLGDYSDGWSETAEVIEFLIELQAMSENKHIFLRGNHDAWTEKWLETGYAEPSWVAQGGQATIDSYIRTHHLLDERHRAFYRGMHNYYIDTQNRGFVHGGFISKLGLGHEEFPADYYWNRTLWEEVFALHINYEDILGGEISSDVFYRSNSHRFLRHKEIFIGHTASVYWKCKPHYPEFNMPEQEDKEGIIVVPMNRCNVWNLDTGGGWSGKLTIMDIDSMEFWQSDFLPTLYPNETGR